MAKTRGKVGREGTALSRQVEPVQGSSLIKAKNINRLADKSRTSSVLRLPNYFALQRRKGVEWEVKSSRWVGLGWMVWLVL